MLLELAIQRMREVAEGFLGLDVEAPVHRLNLLDEVQLIYERVIVLAVHARK